MSETAQKIAETFDMLPEDRQKLAYELLKTPVRNRDPDFTKLTPKEAAELEGAEKDPETFSMDEVLKELGITLQTMVFLQGFIARTAIRCALFYIWQ